MDIKHYMELMRVKNCLSASIGTLIAGLIASNFNIDLLPPILIAALVVFLICGYGNVINDIFDIEIDKINKPHRPLPSNRISLKNAKLFSFLLLITGLLFSLFNKVCFLIALINAVVLYVYAKRYKKNKIVGNLLVAYLTGSIFLFGGAAVNNILITLILFLCALFATWSREIIKDFEDMEGDIKEGVVSLPIKYGIKSLHIAGILLIIAILLSPLPYIMGIFGFFYLYSIILCDIMFIYSFMGLMKNPSKKNAERVSKEIKLIMNFILISFVMGTLLK
ncbi:MAG TPA: digeranylgeranylglyceryl phosphate synthase [Methanothermococcus okinawensis]|uniref:Digeranylgeranylglyceryl phosphate synthase n=1 Tax=Methanothermococcus okinawensis TaxID=155863 RepID=A0A832YSE2_9EURY|nr:digeranylgeranylglyceryl phosphate synthase [Methanothermococcus okinawensis]